MRIWGQDGKKKQRKRDKMLLIYVSNYSVRLELVVLKGPDHCIFEPS